MPVPLESHLEEVEAAVLAAEFVSLFLDFDGTVSLIVPNPRDAGLDPRIRTILQEMAARPDFRVSLVSGRSLDDLRERAALDNVIYAGNHGLEIEGGEVRFRQPEAEALRRELRCVTLQLKLALSETEGLEIEDKGLTLSVHFRKVTEHLHDWVRSVTYSTIGRSRSFTCSEGKMVLEVKPQVTWNKGYAVRWIANEVLPASALAIYIGDDTTDEDGFMALPEGITIRVGESPQTAARYVVPDVLAVREFLDWLNHAKPNASISNSERAGR
ncbi:MAG TPA: trehalose-phosphatase [Bryobacteraceae bacterium]|jgi:trehalose-phosphatase|nr:trehalose-phosphatase [Bryobacteraceae bacterium]